MSEEVKDALSGIKIAWKNMLAASDRETYELWRDEQLRLQKILHDERRRTLQRLRRGDLQRYQHEYYLKVTKPKREEKRKMKLQKKETPELLESEK